METIQTEKKLIELCHKLKIDLIKKLKDKGHYGSGKLADSIEFKFKKNLDKYSVEMESNKYIQYLDEGKFLKEFLEEEKKEITKVIMDNISKDILKEIKQ